MKCILVEQYGGAEVLQFMECAAPPRKTGEVLVEVRAIGVNPVDVICRKGEAAWLTFPFVPGFDAAGVVAASDDSRFQPGDRVYLAIAQACYAEFVTSSAERIHPLPAALSFEEGAALGIPYLTAYGALFARAGLRQGETLFIRGGSGAVGTAAVQFALAAGCKIIASAGSAEGLARLRAYGVAAAVNHSAENCAEAVLQATTGRGVDVILETQSSGIAEDLSMLAQGGRVVVVGDRSEARFDPLVLTSRSASILGFNVGASLSAQDCAAAHALIREGADAGWLRPPIAARFPLVDAQQAHAFLESGRAQGKVVLMP